MSLVARAAVALLHGLVLAAGVGAPAVARPAETVPIPGVGELGHPSGFIGDDGELVLLAKDDGGQVHLLVGKSPSSMGRVDLLHAAEGLFQSIAPLPNNRFVLRSVPDDGSSHGGPISTQVYRFRGTSAPKLLWTGSEADYELSPIRVSADGKLWGVMAPSFASEDARERLGVESPHVEVTSGIHFAFGTFKSSKARRTHTLAFHDWIDDRDIGLSGQSTRFTFLDSDGPVLVTSYADDVYLLRFTDSGVVSEELEPMKPLMAAVPGGVFFRWQDEDRLLWCGGRRRLACLEPVGSRPVRLPRRTVPPLLFRFRLAPSRARLRQDGTRWKPLPRGASLAESRQPELERTPRLRVA